MSFTQEPTNTELSAPSPCDVSRRSFLKLVIAAGGTAAAASALPSTAAAAETPTAYPEKFTFAVMSDVHYLSPDLIAKNASYEIAENSDRKMFSESADILDRALDVVVEQAPDMVIVPGDLTKDGEYLCHEQVADRYRRAQEAIFEATGKQTKFYVINGNHDLNNHHAKDFASAGAEDTVAPDAQRTNPTEYKTDIWADFGYPEATAFFDKDGTRDGSLSYVVRPCPGLTLIVVDSCSYNLDGGDGTLAQETQDGMTQELLDWVCAQAKAAKAAGNVVVAMQHHGIVEHFGYEDEIFGEYLVNKSLSYTAVAEAYADAGISAVFTGHMHANDIAAHTSAAGNTVYDIETGSLVTYPSYMRTGSFEFMQKGDELECTLTVDSKPLDTVNFDLASQGGLVEVDSADITAYGKERTLTVESVTTMLNGYVVDPLLAQVEAGNGIKATIAGLLGCEASALNGQLWSLLTSFLPTSIEDAIAQGFYISKKILIMQVDVALFYNATSGRIEAWQLAETPATASTLDITFTPAEEQQIINVLSSTPSTMAEGDVCALYINAEDFSTFLDKLLSELDQKVLLDTANGGQQTLRDVVSSLVQNLLDSQVNETYSVLGLVDFAYQDHLLGNEQPGGEAVSSAIASIRNDNLLGTLVGAQVNALLEADSAFMVLAEQVACVPSELIKQEGSNVIGGLVVGPLLLGKVKTLADLVELLTGSMLGLDLGATVAGLVPSIELFGQPVPQLAAGALETLSTDTNVADDHHLVATATATIPTEEEKPSGDGSQGGDGGSTGGNGGNGGGSTGGNGGGNGNGSGAGSGSGTSNKPGGPSGTGKPSGGKLVGTGDASMTASLAALLAGSGTIAAGIWARMTGRGDQE
ncbi:metallophosphoesterase [Enorma sp.]|uniref:metallophosphoesterase family protein n=1 Tax=Enorma sp. TaxID=1920692 RepID=UPI0025BE636E|nr:metallophosphoesterase [Enorma sp.]